MKQVKLVDSLIAYNMGYMAAIYRKPAKANPFEAGENRSKWHKGHDRGREIVEYYAESARRGSNPNMKDLDGLW